ncbi:MAG: tRNA pseudouridine(55) synthase TruB, partial [Campylobacter ureolyticus]|nr:tRNA pseudouridine(55) synthase TruB [Campylobacter ureolyticus]
TLSALNRVSEGKFKYEDEKFLNPFEYLNLKENFYLGDLNDLILGKKLNFKNFKFINNGKYLLNLGEFYSIVEIENNQVKYLWNRIKI